MNSNKKEIWFINHKLKCDELKEKYMTCLNYKRNPSYNHKENVSFIQEQNKCKELLNKFLSNRCLMYD